MWLGHLRAQSRDLYQELPLVLKYYQKKFGRVPGGARVGPPWSKLTTQPISEIFFVNVTFDEKVNSSDSFLTH